MTPEPKTEYVLDEVERKVLADITAGAQRAAAEATAPFNAQVLGVVTLIYQQQKLAGNYRLNEDNTKLVKQV